MAHGHFARAELLALVRGATLAELLASLPLMEPCDLEEIQEAFGVEECGCVLEVYPCECPGCACERGEPCDGNRCDCVPDYKPCEHFKTYYLPTEAQALLQRLLRVEPPAPRELSKVRLREAMAVVRQERHEAGEALWHPGDKINQELDALYGRLMRKPLGNGHKVAGPMGWLVEEDAEDGDSVSLLLEIEADRAAMGRRENEAVG